MSLSLFGGDFHMSIVLRINAILALVSFCLASGFVTAAGAEEPVRELPRSGTLSTTFQAGDEGIAVPAPWGAEESDMFDGGSTPVSGSVSRAMSGNEWIAKLFNNSGDRYSVDVEVVQYNDRQQTVKSDSFSTTLQPGQRMERTFQGRSNSHQAVLNLRSWRNLSQEQRDREAALEAVREEAAE